MTVSDAYRAFVVELFSSFGPVSVRSMFGAAGIFAADAMFGIVSGERIYLKTDEKTRSAFEREGAKPFVYTKTKEEIVTSYHELPERLYDEPDELAVWARRAHEVALKSPTAQKKARKKMRQPARLRKRS